MKKLIVSCFIITGIILLASNSILQAQNLVPNPSFEVYDTCPHYDDDIKYAIGWSKYSYGRFAGQPFNTTPDYYNACATYGGMSVPYTPEGYRPDPRGCHAFAGLVMQEIGVPNYREYIGIQLTQSLFIGQKYFISFYAAAALIRVPKYFYGMWSNNIGLNLSTKSCNSRNAYLPQNHAILNSSVIIKDTIKWYLISGSFIADSAYKYLIAGNFYDDAHTDTSYFKCDTCFDSSAYYFIDDICLSRDSLLCNGDILYNNDLIWKMFLYL